MYDMNMNECVIDTELIFGALFIGKSESGNVYEFFGNVDM